MVKTGEVNTLVGTVYRIYTDYYKPRPKDTFSEPYHGDVRGLKYIFISNRGSWKRQIMKWR